MSHVIHMNESRHTHNSLRLLALRRASMQPNMGGWFVSHTREWVMDHIGLIQSHIDNGFDPATCVKESCHTHECVMSHTHEWVMNHTGLIQSYIASGFNPATCVNESCHTHEWVMSQTWLIESYIKDGFNPAGILMDKCVHAITPLCWYQVRDTVFSWYLVSSWHIQLIHITHITNCLTHFQPPYC